jgi:DNA repair exonuclease SbcCD ATPase subunit
LTEILKNEVGQLTRRLDKIESVVETLGEVINNISQAQAVFSLKHDHSTDLARKLEELIKQIHERSDDRSKKTNELFKQHDEKVDDKVEHLREILDEVIKNLRTTHELRLTHTERDLVKLNQTHSSNEKELRVIQKTLYVFSGAVVVIVAIIEYLSKIVLK